MYLPHKWGRKAVIKMAIIYRIEDHKNKELNLSKEEKFKKFLEGFGTWESPEEKFEFYLEQLKRDEVELKKLAKEIPESWKRA